MTETTIKSLSQIRRLAVTHPAEVAEECERLWRENRNLKLVVALGLDMLEQMKAQGLPLPGEVDLFEDRAMEALNAR
jgi:hypothetical protein